MTEHLLKTLALAAGPQTATELHDALRRDGVKVDEYQLVNQLRSLQRDGFVRLEGTRWRLLKAPSTIAFIQPKSNLITEPNEHSNGGTRPIAGMGSNIVPQSRPVGRWGLFRRLCRYYMDCLLQDEAPQLRAYVENEDDTWIPLRDVPWVRLATGASFAVPLALGQAPFQRNRVRRGAEECVYIGYPMVLVKPNEHSPFVVPLFAQPMRADWSAGVLHLEPDGPIAVNGAWLEYRFRQQAERVAFLRAMGFVSDIAEDKDRDEGDAVASGPKDFAQLAQNAAHYLHDPERFSEAINPFGLSQVPDWKIAERGLYNLALLTLGPRLRYTRSLLRDLRDISETLSDEDLDGTALVQLFPHESVALSHNAELANTSGNIASTPGGSSTATEPSDEQVTATAVQPFLPDQLAQTRLLHPNQRAAVESAMSQPVSVVTGPPGTGKSEVVTAMLFNQLLRSQPTLFASKNHQALEAVIPRLNNAVENADLIIQTASRDLAQRQSYLAKLQSLLARPTRTDLQEGEAYHRRFQEVFAKQSGALEDIRTCERMRKEYGRLSQQLDEIKAQLLGNVRLNEALTEWPVDVTQKRLEVIEVEWRRATSRPSNPVQIVWRWLCQKQLKTRRRSIYNSLVALPCPFIDGSWPTEEEPSAAWITYFATWKGLSAASQLTIAITQCEQRASQLPPHDGSSRRLTEAQVRIEEITRAWMQWAAGGLPNQLTPIDRTALSNLRAGIQNWGVERFKKELRLHFPLILRAFPLWSVSNLSARSALPMVPGLFELVIVDEASQCDIASVVPLLARSKRAVFVGDPMQLRHISTLDVAVEQTLLQQYKLTDAAVQRFTYRVNSAFDLGDANPAVDDVSRVRLDLHFRSHSNIADYCNEAFYAKTLHIVTATDKLKIPHGMEPGIHWTHIDGRLEPGPTGAWCEDEIEAIRLELLGLVSRDYRGTIGVVTPFRQQMLRLKDLLETGDALPAEFRERTQLLVDTAYGFQGGERDLILFSLCGGPDLPIGGALFFNKEPNQFNVAVSRARAILHVFGNRTWASNCGISYIEKLARRNSGSNIEAPSANKDPYQSPWEKVMATGLQQAGIKTIPQYPIAGRFLDLAIVGRKKIDVEVDGESFHRTAGGGRKDDDHWRDLQLQSLGWRVCRFWVYEIREDLPRCIQKVASLLAD